MKTNKKHERNVQNAENLEILENKVEEKVEVKVEDNEKKEDTILEKQENNTENSEQNNLAEEIKKLSETKDKRLRTLAEFENYKKRAQNELSDFFKYSSESMIKKMLPIYDDLSRSISHIPEELSNHPFVNGIKMVYDKFTKTLTDEGVKKIETTGRQFDFNFHEALLQQPNDQIPHDQILQEVEAGYIYKDKVIRHAKVIVCVNESQNVNMDNNENNNATE
jgi:molecular chaperone GrpE